MSAAIIYIPENEIPNHRETEGGRVRKRKGRKEEGGEKGRRGKGEGEVCSSSDTGKNTAKAPGFA